jgi:hypothetical protein
MSTLGITNPVHSPLAAEASGWGVAAQMSPPGGVSVPAILGVSSNTEMSDQVERKRLNADCTQAQALFISVLKAKNLHLGCTMSQMEFDAVIDEDLADWDALRPSSFVDYPQPLVNPSSQSCIHSQHPPALGNSKPSPTSKATIQPGRSIKELLASGEYPAPDVIQHVHNLQYAPLLMFSVKEMHEHHLSNMAYPIKTEIDIQTRKKKTVINTDASSGSIYGLPHFSFVSCFLHWCHSLHHQGEC